jgi:cytochrome P450
MSLAAATAARPITPFDASDTRLYVEDRWQAPFAALRRDMPISFRPESPFGPYWSVTTHELVREIEANPKVFSSSHDYGGITIEDMNAERALPNFIAMDGERHAAQRNTVAPAFKPGELARREEEIRKRTAGLFDALPVGETFDWVSSVSTELTIGMLAILFDFPWEERMDLRRWSDWASDVRADQSDAFKAEFQAQMFQMLGRFDRLLEEKRKAPPADDLISRMVHSDAMGNMPDLERLANIALLIVGGNDTTRNSMSAFAHICNLFPEQFEALRADPSLIPNAAQEVIRWQSPVTHMRRTCLADTEVGGQLIRKGEKVILWYISANRDESVFPDADRVDFARDNVHRHVSFGFGVHRCVGLRLAEMQLCKMFGEVVRRNVRIELAGAPQWGDSPFLHIYTKLPVRLVPIA